VAVEFGFDIHFVPQIAQICYRGSSLFVVFASGNMKENWGALRLGKQAGFSPNCNRNGGGGRYD